MDDLITLEEAAHETLIQKGKRWLVTIAVPGQGSHGYYSEEVLRDSGPRAFPPGTKSFFKHAKPEDRDPRDQVGVFEEGAFWNEDEGKLQGFLTPFPRYTQVLQEAGTNVEASLRAAARNIKGIVKELVFRRDNTVDLVAFGGLEGSGLVYQVESLFAAASADSEDGKEKNMAFEITEEAWKALSLQVESGFAKFDTFVAESATEKQGVADKAAVDAAVEARVEEALTAIAEKEKAVDAADIPVIVKESLKADVRKGIDVSDDLAMAVSIVAETKKELAPGVKDKGRANIVVVDESLSGETAPKNYAVGRWAGKVAK